MSWRDRRHYFAQRTDDRYAAPLAEEPQTHAWPVLIVIIVTAVVIAWIAEW